MNSHSPENELFKNTFVITEEDYLNRANHPMGKAARAVIKRWKLRNTILLAVATICFLISILVGKAFSFIPLYAICLCVLIYNLFFRRNIANKRAYRNQLQLIGEPQLRRTFLFSEDNFCVQDGTIKTIMEYTKVKQITDDDVNIYLWLNENYVFFVPKASFTIGTAEQFLTFINEKIKTAQRRNP